MKQLGQALMGLGVGLSVILAIARRVMKASDTAIGDDLKTLFFVGMVSGLVIAGIGWLVHKKADS
jgi:Na+/H+-translocating membrane pyrophosphatase